METSWMGRYRPLVAELVRHTNIVMKGSQLKSTLANGVSINPQEWQILEYVVEHREDDIKMIDIADTLQIPQSSFSKYVIHLNQTGLLEKYQAQNNKKNIILRPTDDAIKAYRERASKTKGANFANFFAALDEISDEDLTRFVEALRIHNDDLTNSNSVREKPELVKIK